MSYQVKRKCACGNATKFLCDALVPVTREERWRRFKAGEHVGGSTMTCDAPLCDSCAIHGGNTFVCGRTVSATDSIDFCPKHAPPAIRVAPNA